VSNVKKFGGCDMDKSNPYGKQVTHFDNWVENPTATNFTCNHIMAGVTFEMEPTKCASLTSEGKTQVGWIITIGHKMQRCGKVKHTPPKGSPCHVPNLTKWLWDLVLKSMPKI
jgi:hypothetical protein